MRKMFVGAVILYGVTLVFAVGYGAMRFAEFYDPPAFSKFGAGEGVSESVLLASYDRALDGDFGRYRQFMVVSGPSVAVLLGIASALFGLRRGSVLFGICALIAGSLVTIAASELLPTVWFPLDRYGPGFIWLMRGAPIATATWLIVTVSGHVGPGRAVLRTA